MKCTELCSFSSDKLWIDIKYTMSNVEIFAEWQNPKTLREVIMSEVIEYMHGYVIPKNEWKNKVDWAYFSANPHSEAVAYLLAHPDKINWWMFSKNPHPDAVAYLLDHPDKLDGDVFSANPHPDAVAYMLAHPDRIEWDW